MKQPKILIITLLFLALFATAAQATVTLTPATGGGSILDSTVNATSTNLTLPALKEGATMDIGNGTIIINAPAGFTFNTSGSVTLKVTRNKKSGTGPKTNNINDENNNGLISPTSNSTAQFTFTITDTTANSVTNTLTVQGLRVTPTSTTASGNLTITGTAVLNGLASGVNAGILRVVTTPDTTPPVLTLNGANPLQVTINTAIVDPGATATDNIDGDITSSVVSDADNLDTSTLGNYTVNYTVTDSSGNAATPITRIIQIVNAADTTAPVITLTGSTPVVVEAGTAYNDAGATANDNVDGNITVNIVTVNPVNTNVLGNYTVTYNVNDTAGNPSTQVTRTVSVIDTTAPTLTRLGSSPVAVTQGDPYVDAGATATDSFAGNLTASIVTVNPVNTAVLGNYTITYDVSDSSGNNATQVTRTVTVVAAPDVTPPVITLLGNNPETVEAKTTYTDAGVDASDNVDGNVTGNVITVNNVNTNVTGNYQVTYNVNDSSGNNATQVVRNVTVVDTTAPVITRNGISPLAVIQNDAYVDSGANATDNYDGDLTASIVTVNPVNTAVLGNYTVTYDVTDANGNPATQVTRTVNVVAAADVTPPVITLLGADPVYIELGLGSGYTDPGADATDNVDGNITANIIVDTSQIASSTLGTYYAYYDVNDSSGNPAAQVNRTIIVQDTTAPVITLTGGNETVEVNSFSYLDLGATANDDVDGNITASIVTDNNLNESTVGNYTFTYDVSDLSGNNATQVTRTVSVVDTTPPVITLNGSDPVTIEVGTTYNDDGATANDNYDGNLTVFISTVNNVNANTVGTYNVTYDLIDTSGNAATQVVRVVNVVDTTAPTIIMLGTDPTTIEALGGYVDSGAQANDNFDGNITANIVTVNSVDANTLGTYNVTYDVNDSSGNNATRAVRTVNVVDTTVPIITLNGSDPVTIEVGTTYNDDGATANDNYDGNRTTSIVTVNTVNANVIGNYTITYNVNDTSGNNATQVTRTVNVVDTTVPIITLNGSPVLNVEVGSTYVDSGATALDNYDGNLTLNITVTSNVNTNVTGNYQVKYNVNDSSGNAATQIVRMVNVVDTTAPVITILGANPATVIVGNAYTDAGATAVDNYQGNVTASIVTVNNVNTNVIGTYNVTYSVNDGIVINVAGNDASATRTVNVIAIPISGGGGGGGGGGRQRTPYLSPPTETITGIPPNLGAIPVQPSPQVTPRANNPPTFSGNNPPSPATGAQFTPPAATPAGFTPQATGLFNIGGRNVTRGQALLAALALIALAGLGYYGWKRR